MQAPWPSSSAEIDRLAGCPTAHCLRVRIWAIQELLLCFPGHDVCRHAGLWLDQHAPLLLALEAGNDPGEGGCIPPRFDPIENTPFFPNLPTGCSWKLPRLWSSRNHAFLQKEPVLKLLWKAAPRKTHSTDVANMVKKLMQSGPSGLAVVLSIYRCSMLGNYKDAKARPPLPLRFCIYRAQGEKELSHASSKHPFMLYALKARALPPLILPRCPLD